MMKGGQHERILQALSEGDLTVDQLWEKVQDKFSSRGVMRGRISELKAKGYITKVGNVVSKIEKRKVVIS